MNLLSKKVKIRKLALVGALVTMFLSNVAIFTSNANAYGLIYIDPYMKLDGTSVDGHFRTTPDAFCWNNLSGW